MSDAVDTRIVEAKFDSSDFEKGVNKTVKKLDELKKALELKDTGKSITDLTKTANEGIEKAGNSLDKLSNRLTTFTGMVKNQLLGGLAQQVSNVFLQMEQGIMGFVHSISGGQVSAGLNKYTEILNAVRVMTASGVDQSAAYEAVKRLGEYSDQTSYSLSQMTSGMSKLVAAGAKLGDAEKMMEGLSNMAASAGVNIYDANRAFLNFSQAFSSGSMRIQDWMSLENLNMATKDVMDIFMQAGEKAGTLIKDKNGNYKTTNKQNKKVKGGKAVSNKGFRDTLSYGWLDQETMRIATGALSYFEDLGVNLNDLTSEQLEEFSTKAFQAAKEARSFADVMGTLRDVISTGWAQTFEYILGPLDKATKFFTWLSESNLAEIIYSIGEYRNEVLRLWSGIGSESLGRDSTTMLVNSLKNLDAALGSLHKSFQKLLPNEWTLAARLRHMTLDFNNFTKSVKDWFEVVDEDTGKSRADKIAEAFGFIGTAFSVAGRIISTGWNAIKSVFEALEPTFDAIVKVFGNFSASVDEMNKNTTVFDNISNAVQNILTIADPLFKVLPTILDIGGQVGTFFLGMAVDTFALNVQLIADALGFLLEVFGVRSAQMEKGTGVLEGIKNDIVAMGNAAKSAIGAIRTFFDALFGDLKTLLGINKETGELEEGGLFANVKNFFDTNEFVASAKAWIDQAVIDVGSFIQSIPSRLSQFAINIRDVIHGLFYKKEAKSGSAKTKGLDSTLSDFSEYTEVETELKKWLDQAIVDVKKFFADLPKNVSSTVGSFGSLISNFWHGLFYKKEYVNGKGGRQFKGEYIEVATPLKQWLDQAIKDVKQFIKDLPKNIQNGIKEVGSIIEAFWHGLFYKKKQNNKLRGGAQTRLDEVEIETPLKLWLDQTVRSVKAFIQNIPKYVQSAIKYTGSIIRALVNGLFGREDGEDVTADDILAQLRAPFKDLTLTKIIDDLKNIGKTLLNQVISIFTGTDDVETNSEVFATALAEGITWIRTKAESAWNTAKGFIENLPSTIAGFFNGERTAEQIEANNKEQGPVELALQNFAKSVGKFISEIPGTLLTFFDNAINEISKLWTRLYNAITGQGEQKAKAVRAKKMINIKQIDVALEAEEGQVTSPFQQFVNRIGLSIQNIFSKLPQFIAEGIDLGIAGINSAIEWLGSWFADHSITGGDKVEDDLEGTEEQSGLIKAIGNLCSRISEIITTTVPDTLTKAWTWVSTNATEWKDKVGTILNDNGITWENLQTQAENIGTKIGEFISKIPEYINVAGDFFEDLWLGKKVTTRGPKKVADEYGLLVDETGKEIVTRTYRAGGLNKVAARLGESFKNAFSDIGPKILEGLNSALQWVQGGFESITKFFNERDKSQPLGEAIAEAAGADTEDSGFFKAIQNLGQTLKTMITQTIPGFIAAAFEEVKIAIPKIMNSIFGEGLFGDAEKEAEAITGATGMVYNAFDNEMVPKEQTIKNATNASKGLLEILGIVSTAEAEANNIDTTNGTTNSATVLTNIFSWMGKLSEAALNSKWVGIVAVLATLSVVLSHITDIFSVTDEIEAISHGITAAGIGVAFASIGIVLAQIMGIVNQTDDKGNNKKLDNALLVLDKVGTFVKDVMGKLVEFAAIWKGFGFVGNIIELFGEGKDGGFLKTLGKSLAGGTVGISLASILSNFMTTVIGDMGGVAAKVGGSILTFADNVLPAFEKLAALKDDIQIAIEDVPLIVEFMNKMREMIGQRQLDGGNSGKYEVANPEKFASEMTPIYRYINVIGSFMRNLSTALNQFQNVKDPTATIKKMTEAVQTEDFKLFIEKFSDAMQYFSTPYMYGGNLEDMTLQTNILAGALEVFGTGIKDLNPTNVAGLSSTLDVLGRLADALNGSGESMISKMLTGSNKLEEFGLQIISFGSSIGEFFKNLINPEKGIPAINENDLSGLENKADLVIKVAREMSIAANKLNSGIEIENLQKLSEKLPGIGSQIASFVNYIAQELGPDVNADNIDVIYKVTASFNNLAQSINALSGIDIPKGIQSIGDTIKNMIGLGEFDGNITDYLKMYAQAMQESEIPEHILHPELTPVLNMSQVESDINTVLSKAYQLNLQPAIEGALSVQMMGFVDRDYGPALSGIRSDVAGLGGRIDSIATSIGDVATSISQIKIVVNNGSAGMVWDNGRRGAIIQPGRP